MRYELRRIELWPVAKIVFILSLPLGFFIGVLYAGLFALISVFSQSEDIVFNEPDISTGALSVFIVLIFTFLIPVIYTVFSVVFVALYNLIASWSGGFRVEFEDVDGDTEEKLPVG